MFMPKGIFKMLKYLKISNYHLAIYCTLTYSIHIEIYTKCIRLYIFSKRWPK